MAKKKQLSELDDLVHHRQELYKTLDNEKDDYDEKRKIIDEINRDIIKLSRFKAAEMAEEVDEKTKKIIKKREAITQELKDIKAKNIVVKETITDSQTEKLIVILLSHRKYDTIEKVVKVLKNHTDEQPEALQITVERFIKKVIEQKAKKYNKYEWNDVKYLLTMAVTKNE